MAKRLAYQIDKYLTSLNIVGLSDLLSKHFFFRQGENSRHETTLFFFGRRYYIIGKIYALTSCSVLM